MKIRAWFQKAAAKIAAWKERIATIALGHTVFASIEYAFNYGIYIPVVALLGAVHGGIVMTVLSFATCYLILRFYDWAKRDWLGIEVAKEVADFGPEWIKKLQIHSLFWKIVWWPFSKIALLLLWAVRKGGLVAFFFLSIFTDPFTTTVFLRRESFNGLTKNDWAVFVGSVLVGNFYCTCRTVVIIYATKLFLWITEMMLTPIYQAILNAWYSNLFLT